MKTKLNYLLFLLTIIVGACLEKNIKAAALPSRLIDISDPNGAGGIYWSVFRDPSLWRIFEGTCQGDPREISARTKQFYQQIEREILEQASVLSGGDTEKRIKLQKYFEQEFNRLKSDTQSTLHCFEGERQRRAANSAASLAAEVERGRKESKTQWMLAAAQAAQAEEFARRAKRAVEAEEFARQQQMENARREQSAMRAVLVGEKERQQKVMQQHKQDPEELEKLRRNQQSLLWRMSPYNSSRIPSVVRNVNDFSTQFEKSARKLQQEINPIRSRYSNQNLF